MTQVHRIDSIRDGGAGGGWGETSRNNMEQKRLMKNNSHISLIQVGPCRSHNQLHNSTTKRRTHLIYYRTVCCCVLCHWFTAKTQQSILLSIVSSILLLANVVAYFNSNYKCLATELMSTFAINIYMAKDGTAAAIIGLLSCEGVCFWVLL